MRATLWISLAVLAAVPPVRAPEALEVTGGLRSMVDRYLTGVAQESWKQRAAAIAAIRTPEQVRARQQYVREKFIELLGGFPEKTPLNPRIAGGFTREGYRVEKLIYESLPKLYVTADVYVPTTGQRPYPAVLGVAGHTDAGKASAIYQRGWIAMAKRGFLVLAFDPPSQGERVQCYDRELGRSRVGTVTAEHTNVGLQCILTGSNLAQYIVWDGIRGIDYLLTRGDVDPKRLAVAGNSGGGMQSAYLAVVEPRLAAAAPSCYLTSSEKLWRDLTPQDAEQNVIGLLAAGLDLMDFPLAFAPRPFQFLTAIRDFFPIAGARDSYAEARRTYAIMGQPDRVDFFEYDDGHGWSKPRREATYRWFQKWLNNRPNDQGAEPEFETEPESNLWATPTGQLATSLKGETVQSLNADLGERLQKQRPSRNTDELRRTIAARIGAPLARTLGPPPVVGFGEVGRSGYHIVKLALTAEAGITVPVLLFVPDSGAARKPAVIYLQPGGKAADAGPGGDIEALVRTGRIVLAPDLRGWGESGSAGGRPPHNGTYQISMRAMLVGKTLPGMQVGDLLRVFDYLASRGDVDALRIMVMSKGSANVVALFAAALEPRIRQVACEGGPVSYMDIVRNRFHDDIAGIVVPGILKDFDLPDAAAAIAPRVLWVVDPRMPSGAGQPAGVAAKGYVAAERAYRSAGAAASFRFVARPEGWAFEKVYKDWLQQ